MRCERAMERLLEADPAELREPPPAGRRAQTELSRHVAECERCGRVAAWLGRELTAVEDTMAQYAAAGDADAAADHALRGSAGGSAIEHSGSRGPGRSWHRPVGIALAAAAVVAMLLLPHRDGGGPVVPDRAPPSTETAARVAVTPPPDRGVAVLETDDPTITIIWLYEREES